MKSLEGLDMETTENIRGKELPLSLRKRFNVRSRDYLTVTVKICDDEKCDVDNVWDTLIDGVKEAAEVKKKGGKFQDAEEFLKAL